jgi:hypothetical protein
MIHITPYVSTNLLEVALSEEKIDESVLDAFSRINESGQRAYLVEGDLRGKEVVFRDYRDGGFQDEIEVDPHSLTAIIVLNDGLAGLQLPASIVTYPELDLESLADQIPDRVGEKLISEVYVFHPDKGIVYVNGGRGDNSR